MSAFAVIFDRLNPSVDPDMFERVIQRLKHRGPDGSQVRVFGRVSVGHWHFWTTPEDVGERHPLELNNSPHKLVFDGRLDNRSELLTDLKPNIDGAKLLSDAMLVLHAYDRWGKDCVKHFVGEFAFVILDDKQGELFCARDPLGDRTLYYGEYGSCFVIASEPWAVSGANPAGTEVDERAIAYYFAFRFPQDGRTLFKNIYELLPAYWMTVNIKGKHLERYWSPDPDARIRYKTDEEYAEHFLILLEESVCCRLRSITPVGVQMSGGLDSTSVACLAARNLPSGSLTAISYVFDELESCNERHFIEAVKEHAGIRSIHFRGDDEWPLKDWQTWPFDPNHPEMMPYRLLLRGVHLQAKRQGFRVLLTGSFGDYLYQDGRTFWLADLLSEGRLSDAVHELKMLFRSPGLTQMLQEGYIQQAVIRLAHVPSGWHRRQKHPDWLTSFSSSLLPEKEVPGLDAAFDRHASVSTLGRLAAQISTHEIPYASSSAIELRHPYRDRRLVEFVLALPAYQLFYHGITKYILRNAMRGILPEIVRTRRQPTSLAPLYEKGLKLEMPTLKKCYHNGDSLWRDFVREDSLSDILDGDVADEGISLSLVPWLCVAFERWLDNVSQPHKQSSDGIFSQEK